MLSAPAIEKASDRPFGLFARIVVPRDRAVMKGSGLRQVTDVGSSRAAIGRIEAEIRSFDRDRRFHLTSGALGVHVVLPLAGTATVVSGEDEHRLGPGRLLLLAHRSRADLTWTEGARALIVRMPRVLLQEAVAAAFADPRRVGPILSVVPVGAMAVPLEALRRRIADPVHDGDEVLDRDLADQLVATLSHGDVETLFPVSRSLKRAADHLMAHPEARVSPAALAQIAGVTLPTLRRNAKICLGMPLGRFVEQVRLTWIHQRLQNHGESRSMAQLAGAAGYHNSSTLARNYQRLFGETPTQTRARAFGNHKD